MGMDLSGAGGYFRFANYSWSKVLRLGVMFGWEPAGTEANVDFVLCCKYGIPEAEGGGFTGTQEERDLFAEEVRREWDGGYCSNDYQIITAEDARNLADALERALPDVPDREAVAHKLQRRECLPGELEKYREFGIIGPDETSVESWSVDADQINPLEWFYGEDGKERLRGFITFCLAGEFHIG
jgi:hypothetical protein